MNRNWEEEIDVPVGPDNGFNVGGADQGQPTHFLPRRNRFVFRVKVPAGFTAKDELVWTLTTTARPRRRTPRSAPDYNVDDVVKASETGALGAGTSSPEVRSNKPPAVQVEELKARTVKVGEPLTLVAEVKDDGIPKPRGAGPPGRPAATGAARSQRQSPPTSGARRAVANPRDAAADADHGRQERRPAPLVVRVPRRRRHGDLRSAADQGVGRHARRRQLAVGADLGRAGRCRPTARCRCTSRSRSRAPTSCAAVADDGALDRRRRSHHRRRALRSVIA